jgi:hypothetical protein
MRGTRLVIEGKPEKGGREGGREGGRKGGRNPPAQTALTSSGEAEARAWMVGNVSIHLRK